MLSSITRPRAQASPSKSTKLLRCSTQLTASRLRLGRVMWIGASNYMFHVQRLEPMGTTVRSPTFSEPNELVLLSRWHDVFFHHIRRRVRVDFGRDFSAPQSCRYVCPVPLPCDMSHVELLPATGLFMTPTICPTRVCPRSTTTRQFVRARPARPHWTYAQSVILDNMMAPATMCATLSESAARMVAFVGLLRWSR
jgi:hypothetical protein